MKNNFLKIESIYLRIKIFKNWYMFVPPLSKFFTKDCLAILRNGARFLLRDTHSSDFGTLLEIIGNNDYEMQEMNAPHIIVDMGANIGIFSVLAARMFPDAIVYSIEPEKSNYQQLLKNIKLNGLTNIRPIQVAVGTEYKEVELYLSNHFAAHSLNQIPGAPRQKVKVVPLSFFDKIDALKMDIEGGEYEILLKEIPICSYFALEIHSDSRKEELVFKLSEKYYIKKNNKDVFVLGLKTKV